MSRDSVTQSFTLFGRWQGWRHYACTIFVTVTQVTLLAQSTPLSDLKEYMGHHSIQITVDLYGHMVPRKENSHANAMAQMLLSKGRCLALLFSLAWRFLVLVL